MIFVFSLPLLTLCANVLVNFLILRWSRSTGIVASLGLSSATGLALLLGVHAMLGEFEYLLPNVVTYLALSYCFFHFVHIPVASVRIRVLLELTSHSSMAESDLLKIYGASQILDFRIRRLKATNQIGEANGVFKTKQKKIYYVAAFLAHLKRFVHPRGLSR